jgi:hypothetical protein
MGQILTITLKGSLKTFPQKINVLNLDSLYPDPYQGFLHNPDMDTGPGSDEQKCESLVFRKHPSFKNI